MKWTCSAVPKLMHTFDARVSPRRDTQLSGWASLVQSCLHYTLVYFRQGRDSSVGIATRYGLDSPGIESRCGTRFSAPAQTCPGAHPASCTMGVKRPRRGINHPPRLAPRLKNEYSYTSTPLMDLRGLLEGEFYWTVLQGTDSPNLQGRSGNRARDFSETFTPA